jgi:hypothetical protein
MGFNRTQWRYSAAFTLVDPDGIDQIATEEAIAAQLFDNYENCGQIEHCYWIIQRVTEIFCPKSCALPVMRIVELFGEVYNYLGEWQNALEQPNNGPDEEEAGQAGKDLLILVLRVLQPTYVQAIQQTSSADGIIEDREERPIMRSQTSAQAIPQPRKPQKANLNWLPVTSQTLKQLPSYVADMVEDLACGDKKQTWTLRDLRYDWAALEDLPITDGVMYEIWTRAWIRRGSNGTFTLSPVAMSSKEERSLDVLAWIIERDASPKRRLIVWRVVVTIQGQQ